MNLSKGSIVVYPASNSSERDFKVNSEYNIANQSRGLSRNRVISGMELTYTGTALNLAVGEAVLEGYHITIKQASVISDNLSSILPSGSGTALIYLKLARYDSGNLEGFNSGGSAYLGVEVNVVNDSPNLDLTDTLVLGYITRSGSILNVYNNEKARANLRAQDIYVEGTVTGSSTDQPLAVNSKDDKYVSYYLNKSGTLDEFLANLVISDGQFN